MSSTAKSVGGKTVAKPGVKPVPHAKEPVKPAAKTAKDGVKAPAKPVDAKAKGVPAPAASDGVKKAPKGITIVSNKASSKKVVKTKKLEMPVAEPLFKPGGPKWKPLIPSGPKAPPSTGIPGVGMPGEFKVDSKARLPKKELERYREILKQKRAELAGDVSNMEDEALRQSSSGSLSSLPQHMAEQGSDTFEQSLSLDLAQVDRKLIREIDAALQRIEDGTYGVCERTGQRIDADRLAELPWARYSIEAAREMERRPFQE